MYYFAYGSNMSLGRITQRIPRAKKVGPCVLHRHLLKFHKTGRDGSAKCDALYTGNLRDEVWGVLYEISEREKEILDGFEDVGSGYEVKDVTVRLVNGFAVNAFVYSAISISEELQPFSWYKNHVLTGATEAGLPDDYIQMIEDTPAIRDADNQREKEELEIYQAPR